MIDEIEKQKYIEASKCSDCLAWHKYCDAECCKSIILNIDPERLESGTSHILVKVGNELELEDIRYYRFHDVQYTRGFLRFKKDRIVVIGRKVLYMHDCSRLKDNKCIDHPNGKPEICKALTLENAKAVNSRFGLTPNCLFKYKCREVKKND